MSKRKTKARDERGVSPVIGVVLMVAITVIIAAIAGVTFMNLGGEIKQNAQAGVSIEESGSKVNVSLVTAPRAEGIYVRYTESGSSKIDTTWAPLSESDIGDTVSVNAKAGTTVTVIGEYDGTNSTVRSYEVG